MSLTRVELEPAYILQVRAYRETSELLEIFSPQYGRVGIVANGSRRPKSKFRGYLNPFQPLRLSWSGRGDLMRLNALESSRERFDFKETKVISAFYANELLLKLLHRSDPHPSLFVHYASFLEGLGNGDEVEFLLRRFEMELLTEIGYSLVLNIDCVENKLLDPGQLYEYQIERGLIPVNSDEKNSLTYLGEDFSAIARLDFTKKSTRRAAKRLLRRVLDFHLGDRVLQTRRIASAMRY
ncbi:MAG: DNA repair protein RecO [Pseudomonadota bacterium]|nr:DNA repair protein RecO [Pseudomonadota bacterium]